MGMRLQTIASGQERGEGAIAPPVKLLLTMEEAANALGVRRTFLYTRLLEPGTIFSVKLGNRRLVPVKALQDYVERLMAVQKAG